VKLKNAGSLFPGLIAASALLLLAAILFLQLTTHPTATAISVGPRIISTLGWTTLQATLSTALSILFGTLLAWSLSHYGSFTGRSWYIALLSSALVLPTLVIVLGIVTVLGRSGWLNDVLSYLGFAKHDTFIFGLPGILIAHCYFNASYAARIMFDRFEAIPKEQAKLARSLGLNAWQRFKMIEWPAIAGTTYKAATTIFMLCFTSFSIVLVMGGTPKYNTLEVSIYEAIKLDFDFGRALGLAFTQLLVCGALVLFASRSKHRTRLISAPHSTDTDKGLLRTSQLFLIILFGGLFLLPIIAVVVDGLRADWIKIFTDKHFLQALTTSVLLAIVSTALVYIFSTLLSISYATLTAEHRLSNSSLSRWLRQLISFSSTLYLAVPSLVLGLGFFILAQRIGGSYTLWAVIALLTSNVLMVLPFAVSILAPAMTKSANRYDKLSRSIGLRGWSRWRFLESQLLKSELSYIACLAFCMSLGDLGIIALFGNQDFITLPWLLYQKMGSYRTDEAAGIALIILASGSGKSTLLDLIAGFLSPASGEILWQNQNITYLEPHARPVTTVFQKHNLFEHRCAIDNVVVGINPHVPKTGADVERAQRALQDVGLGEFTHTRVDKLSGGQQQRVAIARAMIRDSKIVLLDEPFSALDQDTRQSMLSLVRTLANNTQCVVIMVTHDLRDCHAIADKIFETADATLKPYSQ